MHKEFDLRNKKYSEEEIIEYLKDDPKEDNWLFWETISYSQTLSENFIREFQGKVDWSYISYYQKLSENFIREFQDQVYWSYISEYQNLSESFLIEFIDKISNDYLKYNEKIPEKVKNRIINLKKVRSA